MKNCGLGRVPEQTEGVEGLARPVGRKPRGETLGAGFQPLNRAARGASHAYRTCQGHLFEERRPVSVYKQTSPGLSATGDPPGFSLHASPWK